MFLFCLRSFHEGTSMVASTDWEDRFSEFVRNSPHDTCGIWALIVECMGDDDSLSHTFNAVLKARGAPRVWCQDLRQDLALCLIQRIRGRPTLNLDHRRTGIPPAVWFYGVIDKLCSEVLRAKRRREPPLISLDGPSANEDDPDGNDSLRREPFEAARHAQRVRQFAVDVALDLHEALAGFDDWTRMLLRAYLVDLRVLSVVAELKLPYATAWRTVWEAKGILRSKLRAYS
jgi:hypothetical protein